MRQALHIFKKDVRYLRLEIAVTMLVAAAFCFTGVHQGMSQSSGSSSQGAVWGPLLILLPIAWWFLITRVVQAESTSGDRQFWLTRPYEWKSLLGAKALFIFVFVNLPLLVADWVILPAFGFSVFREFGGILWTQVLLVAGFVLPVVALSSIFNGIGPLITAILLSVLGVLAMAIFSPRMPNISQWIELEWVQDYYALLVIAVAALIIIFWQYKRRRTGASRLLAVSASLLIGAGVSQLPWTTAFALQARLSQQQIDPSSMQVELDLERKWLGHVYPNIQDQIVIDLPIQVRGVPAGMDLKANGLTVAVSVPGGEIWRSEESPRRSVATESGVISLRAVAGSKFYAKVRDLPVELRGTLFFTLYGHRRSSRVPLNQGPVAVKGAGQCSSGAHFVLCSSAFRAQPDLVSIRLFQNSARGLTVRTEYRQELASYSPFPAELGLNPIDEFFAPQGSTVSDVFIDTLEPVAHLRRDFALQNVRLSEFESHVAAK